MENTELNSFLDRQSAYLESLGRSDYHSQLVALNTVKEGLEKAHNDKSTEESY